MRKTANCSLIHEYWEIPCIIFEKGIFHEFEIYSVFEVFKNFKNRICNMLNVFVKLEVVMKTSN